MIGFLAPRVLIPDWLLPRLTGDELNQIVLHESTHLARYDDWTNLLQKLCLVVFPLNPGLFLIDRELAKEREMACDEAVVRITQAPRAYAACLASLAERGMARRREALSLGTWQRRSELVSRIHRILRGHPGLSPAAARLLLGAFGCGLLLVTFELARCPQLVAFVPAVEKAQSVPPAGSASAQFGDAVYPANPRLEALTPGAHMVQTRAVLPAVSIAKPFAGRAHAKIRAEGELRAAASEPGTNAHASTHQLINARAKTDAPEQLIVFTTWAQIETTPAGSRTADRRLRDIACRQHRRIDAGRRVHDGKEQYAVDGQQAGGGLDPTPGNSHAAHPARRAHRFQYLAAHCTTAGLVRDPTLNLHFTHTEKTTYASNN